MNWTPDTLRLKRMEAGFTQVDLGRLVFRKERIIRHYEKGTRKIPPGIMYLLDEIFQDSNTPILKIKADGTISLSQNGTIYKRWQRRKYNLTGKYSEKRKGYDINFLHVK